MKICKNQKKNHKKNSNYYNNIYKYVPLVEIEIHK